MIVISFIENKKKKITQIQSENKKFFIWAIQKKKRKEKFYFIFYLYTKKITEKLTKYRT